MIRYYDYLTYQAFSHHRWWLWYLKGPRSQHPAPSRLLVHGHCSWKTFKQKMYSILKPPIIQDLWQTDEEQWKTHFEEDSKQTCCWLLFLPRTASEGICLWFSLRSCSLSPPPKHLPQFLHVPQGEVAPCPRCLHGHTNGGYPQSFHTTNRKGKWQGGVLKTDLRKELRVFDRHHWDK